MITLAIDTSTSAGSVAVYAYNSIVYQQEFTADRSHSSALFQALGKARGYAGKIDRIAVGLGPGSYAGIRIGISAAMGMNLVFGTDLVGIPSVAALRVADEEYVAIGDARRGAYYFTWLHGGTCQDGPRILSEVELRQELVARTLPAFATEPIAAFPSLQIARPCAVLLAKMATNDEGIVQVRDLEPLYLREPHITKPKTSTPPPPSEPPPPNVGGDWF
jgi:tRNA threonylcarbamoyladenosine biosynthesis protein TsaB